MIKKFNWGHGITIFYICFVGVVITALIASFGVDHSLVVDDYYAKDLAYQSQYDKAHNDLLSQNVKVVHDEQNRELTVHFINTNQIYGYIDFYRPSDKSKDFIVNLKDNKTVISTQDMLLGKWILKIDWIENGKSYYREEAIYI